MLGGAGQVTLAAREYGLCDFSEMIITADVEKDQIKRAAAKGLPALPLDVVKPSIIRPSSVNHLIYAYGFHHLSLVERRQSMREAAKILRSGGTLVVYDGVIGSTTERISSLVVDSLSKLPHAHSHPTEGELTASLQDAGLEVLESFCVFDPQVFFAKSGGNAKNLARDYYAKHYAIPDPSWSDLSERLSAAYRSSTRIDAAVTACGDHLGHLLPWDDIYCGPVPADLVRETFPVQPVPVGSCDACVVFPREGFALLARKN